MRAVLIIAMLALSGCASWFRSDPPKVESPAAHAKTVTQLDAAKGYLAEAGKAKDEAEYRRKVELAERSAKIAREDADAALVRETKAKSIADIIKFCVWAIGIGVLIELAASIPMLAPFLTPLRSAGVVAIVAGTVIAVGAPWLSEILSLDKVKLVATWAFGIIAGSAAVGFAWWLLDKVRDAARKSR